MADAPAISVVLAPTSPAPSDATGTALLAASLRSLATQRPAPCELILVGAARDATIELARALLPDLPLRVAASHAQALAAARGACLAWLAPGERWTPGGLAALARALAAAPAVGAVRGHARLLEAPGAPLARRASAPYPTAGQAGWLRRRAASEAPCLLIPDVVLEQPLAPPPLAEPLAEADADELPPGVKLPRGATLPCSVILAVREGRRYLPAALASLRRQSLRPAEILALVGPSGDGTLDYLAAQPDIRVVPQRDAGLAAARNEALAAARHPLVAFLDHDDLWHPRKLESQAAVLALFAGPAACLARFRTVRNADPDEPGRVVPSGDPRLRVGWTPSALLAHRAVFARVGPFDPATGLGCDTDWFFRLRAAGPPCGVTPAVLLDKRLHGGNLSADNTRNRAALFQVIRKNRPLLPGA